MNTNNHHTPDANHGSVIGILERQLVHGQEQISRHWRNELRGNEQQIMVQVPSPFGRMYALPITCSAQTRGFAALSTLPAGTPLRIDGALMWEGRNNPRHTFTEGRQRHDLSFWAAALTQMPADHSLGSECILCGRITTPARILRHPYRPSILLAYVTMRVPLAAATPQMAQHSIAAEQIPVVVPLQHPDAQALLRPGNRVALKGMLERVLVTLNGDDIDQACAALDQEWQQQQAHYGSVQERMAAERQYRWRRQRIREVMRSRVVAQEITLLSGTPATPRESQALREQRYKRRQRQPTA
ncbi:MAG: hypothetical protein Fur005_22820 [Roseiflexaceae bacterium]